MILGARQVGAHGHDGDVCRAEFAPARGVLAPALGIAARDPRLGLDAEALWPLKGRGLGIIPDDTAIYRITASKELVASDSETGAWLTVTAD